MKQTNSQEFKLSKSKLLFLMLLTFVFITLGIAFIKNPEGFVSNLFRSPDLILSVGIVAVIFSGLCLIVILKKMFDTKPGIIIDDNGIFDNASGISAGFIPWEDIIEIKETKVSNQSFINIVVKNPQDYINRQKNILMRKLAEVNYKSFGTVIGIPSNALDCKFEDLIKAMKLRFEDYKNSVVES